MKKLIAGSTIVLASVICTGCPWMIPAVSAVSAAISDAESVLSIAEMAVNSWFTSVRPDPELRKQATYHLSNCWTALRIANSTVAGVKNLNEDEKAAAFEDFQKAYTELHNFLKEYGVLRRQTLGALGGAGGAMEAEEIDLPEPVAMKFGRK